MSERNKLSDTRSSVTHKFNIGAHEGYVTVGKFEDGKPGELFIKMAKQGSTMSGLMDTIGVLTSLCFQYGVPPGVLAKKFADTKFEPSGETKDMGFASSIVDYIYRWIEKEFDS